ncbi:MAG: hypothetical protein AAFP83_14185, partial [Bacteroidota bacterium]
MVGFVQRCDAIGVLAKVFEVFIHKDIPSIRKHGIKEGTCSVWHRLALPSDFRIRPRVEGIELQWDAPPSGTIRYYAIYRAEGQTVP